MQTNLNTRALQSCGEKDPIRGNRIQIAPLQISKEWRNLEAMKETGHFHRREEIVEIYYQDIRENICHTKLFEEAKQHATNTSPCSNDEAKANHILKHGNLVLIAGQAGVGKTTFTKLLVKEMVDPNIRLFEADYVFYLRFRDVDYDEKSDLLTFLTTSADFAACIQREERKKILKALQKCDTVYIIMDGLDEAIIDPKAKQPKCNALSVTTAAVFIKNILSGDIFPHAKKLVTSRPRQLAHLLAVANESNFVVKILGLNDDGQKNICEDLCGKDNIDRRDKILEYIHSRPDLKSYCYVPINCILIVMSFNKINMDGWRNVDSLSSILITALEEWFLKNLESQFQTKEISSLAHKGFLSDRFYFREIDLKEANLNSNHISTFLTNNICFQLLKGKKVSYFCHLIWQEFFVAVALRLYTTIEEFQSFVSQFETDKYEVVTKFLFGLCNEAKLEGLLALLEETEGLNSREDREKCKETLKRLAIEKLEKLRDDHAKDYLTSVLPVLGWVFEMKDESFTQQASRYLRDKIKIEGQIFPSDIPSFSYILQYRETKLTLDMEHYFFRKSCQYFIDILYTTLGLNEKIQVCKM